MKIYYSKFVGVGYLVFAVGVFFQFSFFLAHGLIDFSQLNLLTGTGLTYGQCKKRGNLWSSVMV